MAARNTSSVVGVMLLVSWCEFLIYLKIKQTPFSCFFSRTAWISRYQKGKPIQAFNKARDDEVFGDGSCVSQTTWKQAAPRFKQLSMPTAYRSIFMGRMLFLMPNQLLNSVKVMKAVCDISDLYVQLRRLLSYNAVGGCVWSAILRAYLEQWLRLVLRWDADKRGGPRDANTGRLQCFKLLEQIISVKVSYLLSVFRILLSASYIV